MIRWTPRRTLGGTLGGAVTAAVCLAAAPGWSMTVDEAWQAMKDDYAALGMTMTSGSVDKSGGVMTVSDIVISHASGGSSITFDVSTLTLTETGSDVVLTRPDTDGIGFVFRSDSAASKPTRIKGVITDPGGRTVVSRQETATRYDYDASRMTVEVTSLKVDGEKLKGAFNLEMAGIKSGLSSDISNNVYLQTLSADTMSMVLDMKDPRNSRNAAEITATIADFSSDVSGDFNTLIFYSPEALENQDISAFSGTYSHRFGQTEMIIHVTDAGESLDMQIAASGADATGALKGGTVTSDVSIRDAGLTMSGSDIPLPQIKAKLSELAYGTSLPLAKTDDFAPADLRIRLGGLEIDKAIWSLFDPGAVLPRDPIDFSVDVSGKVKWLANLFDEDEMLSMIDTDDPGIQVSEATINELLLSALGAKFTAGGSFTFDNSDRTTFNGLPAPKGTVTMSLTGLNGLMTRLAKLKVLPKEQIVMVKGMIGMIAQPGEGGDEYVSQIKVKPNGKILANGIPLPF